MEFNDWIEKNEIYYFAIINFLTALKHVKGAQKPLKQKNLIPTPLITFHETTYWHVVGCFTSYNNF